MEKFFSAYLEQCLAPTLKRGDIVVIDNLLPIKSLVLRKPSRQLVQVCATCRSILRTSIRSRWCFIRSRRFFAKSRSQPSRPSANGSNGLSGPSKQANVWGAFGMQVMHHFDRNSA